MKNMATKQVKPLSNFAQYNQKQEKEKAEAALIEAKKIELKPVFLKQGVSFETKRFNRGGKK